MKKIATIGLVSAGALGLCPGAHGDMTGTLTADNHYALYAEVDGLITYIGGNETGASGAPGRYNWSRAESWTLPAASSTLYVAAWSDDAVAQGLLAAFDIDGVPLLSGDAAWRVYETGVDLDTGAPHPDAADVASHVSAADAGGLWETPFVGARNLSSTGPWGKIDGITDEARWMWAHSDNGESTLMGGANHGEYLIFTATVPAPASLALLLGVAAAGPRRRRA